MGWIIVLVIIAVVVFWAVGGYNRLVSLRNKFKNAFAHRSTSSSSGATT
jgi:LemA protein